ncbi:hypothetical protein HPB47_002113 [Ixodes persulcatus]|uniref:Uncharacterized protein n=1 Tax=Ixodes persulcatus TaxID=34615 RepID=A0AC60PMK2_IXOPE|nr:hypothetical protein HPB47_002113 [Ixodes persulcatus]
MKEKDAVGTSYRLGQLWRRATLAQRTANEAAEVFVHMLENDGKLKNNQLKSSLKGSPMRTSPMAASPTTSSEIWSLQLR